MRERHASLYDKYVYIVLGTYPHCWYHSWFTILLQGSAFQKPGGKARDQIPSEYTKMQVRYKAGRYLSSTESPAIKHVY